MKTAVFGATGPVGRRTARALRERGVAVRVVSRSPDRLEEQFGDFDVELHPADVAERAQAVGAARGCDLVVHAVGVPAHRFELHVPLAENAVAAARKADARCLLVTSYWSYGPGDETPMPESRPRAGDSVKAAIRARQEEVFLGAGGAVARLPDFYGPEPGDSLLNDALASVVAGETVRWPGDPDAPRDFLHYGDAGRVLAELALREEAFGEAWNVPGSGARPPRELLEAAARTTGVELDLRPVGRWLARLASIFDDDVRALLDVMPLYEAPAILDTSRIRDLLGEVWTTPYEEGVPATLEWLQGRAAAPEDAD